jgi:uncharacterized protein YcbK (DUF882 family)
MIDWAKIKHFKKTENWGNPDKMDESIVLLLDKIRDRINYPFHINCGYDESGHSDNSMHYQGKAVDFIIKDLFLKDASDKIISALKDLNKTDKVGLGIYLDWNTPGFHLDTRGFKARWGRYQKKYIGYDEVLKHV